MIFLELFLTFLKIGAFTFGGGYAMLPLVQAEVAEKGWLTGEALVNFLAISESTPGPFAVNMATYVGAQMGGVFGAVCATAGVVLPSFVIILIIAKSFMKFKDSRTVRGFMYGLKPAVVGLIATAVLSVGKTVFFPNGVGTDVFATPDFYVSVGIFGVGVMLAFRKVHPVVLICLSALLGIAAGYLGLLSL